MHVDAFVYGDASQKRGAWSAILVSEEGQADLFDTVIGANSHQMQLECIRRVMLSLPDVGTTVTIHTNSAYAIQNLVQTNELYTPEYRQRPNFALIDEIRKLIKHNRAKVIFSPVRGNSLNNDFDRGFKAVKNAIA